VTNILEGKKVPLYGTGMNVRDWIYVVDNCEAIDFISNKGERGGIYNIGGGNEKTNKEITLFIIKTMGKSENSISYVEDRLGHDLRYSVNTSKINNLGWNPQFKFENALTETVKWYEDNPLWWRRLKGD
jgi:dTDP-glucose 4,6-dehydratase